MKKAILAAALLAGFSMTATAQKATTVKKVPVSVQTNAADSKDKASFDEAAKTFKEAMNASQWDKAREHFHTVQSMTMKRGDTFLGKDEAKAKQWHDMGYQLKGLSVNMQGNKDQLIALTDKIQSMY